MAKRRRITGEDLYRFRFLSDAQVSPDGQAVLFTVTRFHPDRKKNAYENHIFRLPVSGGAAFQFTSSNESESNPRWSPDGRRVLFLSARDSEEERKGKTQLWVMPADGGEGIRITSERRGAANPKWSPDGKSILFLGRVPDDPAAEKLPPEKKSHAMRIRRLSWRMNGLGPRHDYRVHAFVVPTRGGRPVQLTEGDWDVEDAAWDADGKRVLIAGNSEDADLTFARKLYAVPAGGGRMKELCGLPGPVYAPTPAPDGSVVYFAGSDLRRSFGTNQGRWSVPAAGGEPVNLTADWDGSIGQSVNSDCRAASPFFGPAVRPDGGEVRFLASIREATRLCSFDPSTRAVTMSDPADRTIESYSQSADWQTAAFTVMTPTGLAEVHVEQNGREKPRTGMNHAVLSRLLLAKPRRFSFKASDGVEVEGWIQIPPGSRRKKHPAVLEIHGGPRTAYGLGFFHEFHLLNAAGFAVFYINPRGSSSYGEDWATAVGKHYGERDYLDVMEAVDHVVANEPIDPERLGVTGGSYGGFLTNWIVGHTKRFKAAVTQRGISNFASFFGTSDIGWRFAREEVGGVPWENLGEYWKRSPLAYVDDVTTPLLIIHSEEDWRCPVEQAEQLFTALKVLGKEVEFLRFPGENHELSRSGKPKHRLERLAAIVEWFDRHLK